MKKTHKLIWGCALLAGALAIGPISANVGHDKAAKADINERAAPMTLAFNLFGSKKDSPANQGKGLYEEECAACHIAYPAKFLPARSWAAIMSGLENHFGDNAELDPKSTMLIRDYLVASGGRGHKVLRRLKDDETPLRVTDLPGYKRIHHELPKDVLQRDAKLTSMSQCNACHRDAERGKFDEDDVDIPGIGHWDD